MRVHKGVPKSTTAGTTIRTDMCDGAFRGGFSGGISTRVPRRRRSPVLVPLCSSYYQENKIGLKDGSDEDVQSVVQCLVSLPLLPPEEISPAIDDVEADVLVDGSHENQLRQLIRYVRRPWINKRSVGPERLSVHAR